MLGRPLYCIRVNLSSGLVFEFQPGTLQPLQLNLTCVRPSAASHMQILGYETETTREPIDVKWTWEDNMAVVTLPSDLAVHASVMAPGFVLKFQGEPQSCSRQEGALDSLTWSPFSSVLLVSDGHCCRLSRQ